MNQVIETILDVARIPSFSSFEEPLHPYIKNYVASVEGAILTPVEENNLLVELPGNPDLPAIAITSHLDKINHYIENPPEVLQAEIIGEKLKGLLDDAVGIGLCLSILSQAKNNDFPTLYVLFSEMEEGTDLRFRPHIMRNGGEGMMSGMGANRLARHLIKENKIPEVVITIDVTPKFQGKPGIAIYTDHWEFNKIEPSDDLILQTRKVSDKFLQINPEIQIHNNTNDYLEYGKVFNTEADKTVISVAIEPSVKPYHQIDEEVYISDVLTIQQNLIDFLNQWNQK